MPVARVDSPSVQELPWTADPMAVAAGWPADRPLMMLCSAHPHRRWARWSILASPAAVLTVDGGGSTIEGAAPPGGAWPALGRGPLRDLAAALAATARRDAAPRGPVFRGGWIGFLSYDLGAAIEPAAAGHRAIDDRGWPLIELAWCRDALVHEATTGRWWSVGDPPHPDAVVGDGGAGHVRTPRRRLESTLPRAAYERAVARVVEYIGAGDVFQVNLAQRLTTSWRGDVRALGRRALSASGAMYGAYLELSRDRRLVSLSPELFLDLSPKTRRVVTRPIKGTRPGHVDRGELRRSEKDAAELHMIVDLMRNDLGRVCRFGSISVPRARRIESYPTVHHGVAEVRGRLRDDVDIAGLVAATFPGGSITGAPKIRAMQIIDELEPVKRGPYCGAIGWFGDDGRVALNIAIRTIALSAGARRGDWTLDYGVGAGIVADSEPAREYRECLDKAAVLEGVI